MTRVFKISPNINQLLTSRAVSIDAFLFNKFSGSYKQFKDDLTNTVKAVYFKGDLSLKYKKSGVLTGFSGFNKGYWILVDFKYWGIVSGVNYK